MTFIKLSEIEEREVFPMCHVRFVHSENMTFSHWKLEEGASLPEHSHPHEQVCTVIDGELELTVGGEMRRMPRGLTAIIPSNCPHSAKAITECYVIDVFYPIREDCR